MNNFLLVIFILRVFFHFLQQRKRRQDTKREWQITFICCLYNYGSPHWHHSNILENMVEICTWQWRGHVIVLMTALQLGEGVIISRVDVNKVVRGESGWGNNCTLWLDCLRHTLAFITLFVVTIHSFCALYLLQLQLECMIQSFQSVIIIHLVRYIVKVSTILITPLSLLDISRNVFSLVYPLFEY